jgi:hypothetical protein
MSPSTKLDGSRSRRPGQAIAWSIEIVRLEAPRLVLTRGRTVGPIRLAGVAA